MPPQIAVFEQSPTLLKLFAANLQKRGFQVFPFLQAQSLSDIEALKPDLVVFGNMRGIQDDELLLLKQFKKQSQFYSTPVIFATTSPFLKLDEWREFPGIYTLPKPFGIQDLLDCITEALRSVTDQRDQWART